MGHNDWVIMFCTLSYKYFKLNEEYEWWKIRIMNYQNESISVGMMNSISYKYRVNYYKVRPSLNMVDLNYELWIWNWDWGIQLFILIKWVLKFEKES
jgi:hypothetical protein